LPAFDLFLKEIPVKKPFLFALGLVAVTAAACGGKVVVESSGGTGAGGAGGTASTFTTGDGAPGQTSVATVGVSTVAATSVTSGSGMGGCNPSYTCAEAITPPAGDPALLCDNTVHAKIYDALVQCTCVDVCQVECSGSVCIGQQPSQSCSKCLQDPMTGCGSQFAACANDI
jgi:hypothetical protein